LTTPSPRPRRTAAELPREQTLSAGPATSGRTAPAPRPAAEQQHARQAPGLPGADTTANAADHTTAADREARTPAAPLEWDLSDLDPADLEHPWTEYAEPEYPDPSWPGFAPGRSGPTYVLAVGPWYRERHPDKAANPFYFFRLGPERHRDPEPDLEAEP